MSENTNKPKMREPKDTDFFIPLPGVGDFRFGRRTLLDRAKIRSEILRHSQGQDLDDPELTAYIGVMAAHKVLCVEAPAGWEDMENLDVITHSETKVFELYAALRDAEDRFRQGSDQGGEAAGA